MSEHIFETSDSDDGLAVYVTSTIGITGAEPRGEIIRCGDCRKSDAAAYDFCEFYYAHDDDDDGFCAWAERREA